MAGFCSLTPCNKKNIGVGIRGGKSWNFEGVPYHHWSFLFYPICPHDFLFFSFPCALFCPSFVPFPSAYLPFPVGRVCWTLRYIRYRPPGVLPYDRHQQLPNCGGLILTPGCLSAAARAVTTDLTQPCNAGLSNGMKRSACWIATPGAAAAR